MRGSHPVGEFSKGFSAGCDISWQRKRAVEQVKLEGLIEGLALDAKGSLDQDVAGLAYDSRQVKAGQVFVAIRGFRVDGHDFAEEAVRRGAVAVVGERWLSLPASVTQVRVQDSRAALGLLSARFYGYPSRRLRVIGVTGTNGKTTTTYLIRQGLRQCGRRVGLIGTIANLMEDRALPAIHTTPESLDLQAMFSQMVQAGIQDVVMEVSSHSVALKRLEGTEFQAGVFTNITQDHLDFHRTFEEYLAVKASFFSRLQAPARAVVNADDPHADAILARCPPGPLTYSTRFEGGDLWASHVQVEPHGTRFLLHTHEGEREVRLHLTGHFNVYNSLAALGVGLALGTDQAAYQKGLEQVAGVPGRFQAIHCGQPFAVVVDYAHTPDGLQNVLQAARALTKGRVIVAFGCGGDRDRGKRPIMGSIGARLADWVIITTDNPRSEDPVRICQEVENGVLEAEKALGVRRHETVVDRAEAIHRAVRLARPGDVVLIAGKGHETYQIFQDRTIHFDDREVAGQALREAGYAAEGETAVHGQ